MLIPHALTYYLAMFRIEATKVTDKLVAFYWLIKNPSHEDYVATTFKNIWDTTPRASTFEPEWFNDTTFNSTMWNRTHYHNGTQFRNETFTYNCTSLKWYDVRFTCFWRAFRGYCYGGKPLHRKTRAACPLECGICKEVILALYTEVKADKDDRYGKALETVDPCRNAYLYPIDPMFEHAGDIYLSHGEKLRWKEAYLCCKRNGLELMSPMTHRDMARIKYHFKNGIKDTTWIGVSDASMEGHWHWPDRNALRPGFFLEREPNNLYGDENCGATFIQNRTFRLHDRQCDDKLRFMCKKEHVVKYYGKNVPFTQYHKKPFKKGRRRRRRSIARVGNGMYNLRRSILI